jgi:hypothetical protein
MNTTQAINVLAIATEPGVKLTRADYVNVHDALEVLKKLIESQPAQTPPDAKP